MVHWKQIEHSKYFVWFDSLRPINNLSVIKGQVFLGRTSTKLGLMFLLKDTTQWRRWGSNPRPLGLESSTLPLSHCAPSHSKYAYSNKTLLMNTLKSGSSPLPQADILAVCIGHTTVTNKRGMHIMPIGDILKLTHLHLLFVTLSREHPFDFRYLLMEQVRIEHAPRGNLDSGSRKISLINPFVFRSKLVSREDNSRISPSLYIWWMQVNVGWSEPRRRAWISPAVS